MLAGARQAAAEASATIPATRVPADRVEQAEEHRLLTQRRPRVIPREAGVKRTAEAAVVVARRAEAAAAAKAAAGNRYIARSESGLPTGGPLFVFLLLQQLVALFGFALKEILVGGIADL